MKKMAALDEFEWATDNSLNHIPTNATFTFYPERVEHHAGYFDGIDNDGTYDPQSILDCVTVLRKQKLAADAQRGRK